MGLYTTPNLCRCGRRIGYRDKCCWCGRPLCLRCRCDCALAKPNSTPMNPRTHAVQAPKLDTREEQPAKAKPKLRDWWNDPEWKR